jgi:hypothetical protein
LLAAIWVVEAGEHIRHPPLSGFLFDTEAPSLIPQNIVLALDRGERLEAIEAKADDLAQAAKVYKKTAKKVECHARCQAIKVSGRSYSSVFRRGVCSRYVVLSGSWRLSSAYSWSSGV